MDPRSEKTTAKTAMTTAAAATQHEREDCHAFIKVKVILMRLEIS
jgi:hypothetical protein